MDLILLNIMGTMSNCVGRPAKINFERKHLGKFQSMGMLLKGVTSESTLCRFDSKTDLDNDVVPEEHSRQNKGKGRTFPYRS